LEGFLTRVQDRNLNRRALEALIKAGALDRFESRSKMLANIENMLTYHKEMAPTDNSQMSLFGSDQLNTELQMEDAPSLPLIQKYKWEKELLGLYVSGHPLEAFFKTLAGKRDISGTKKMPVGKTYVIAGVVEAVKVILTKKGDKMAFVRVSDKKDSIEAIAFPKTFAKYKDLLQEDETILIKGKLSKKDDELNVMLDAVKPLGS